MQTRMPRYAVLATGLITGAALVTPAVPATAAAFTSRSSTAHDHRGPTALSPTALRAVRARQRQMLATHTAPPVFAKAGVTTFTVTTTHDTSLATPTGTHCLDAAGKCSLRAAVEAADNASVPVRIVLGKHTYTLTSATELVVTDAQGVSIVGKGSGRTVIAATGASRVFDETQPVAGAPGPLLFLTGLRVTGGQSDLGGGVYLDSTILSGATLVLDRVVFAGNAATTDLEGAGGAIYAASYATIYASRSAFRHNTASQGGALFTEWSNVDLRNVTLAGNHAPPGSISGGGAWQNTYGVIRMRGGAISGNTAGDPADASSFGAGGGLEDQFGNVALTDVHVDGNTAVGQGGGIYGFLDLVEITGGTISHNRVLRSGTASDGGGIYVTDGGQLDLHGVTLSHDKAPNGVSDGHGGSALYVLGTTLGSQVTLDQGTRVSRANAGAVYGFATSGQVDLNLDHAVLSHNTNSSVNGFSGAADSGTVACGGAVCAYAADGGAVTLSLAHDTLSHNASTSTGEHGSGAIGVFSSTGTGQVRVHVDHSTFAHNHAARGGFGGALGVWGVDGASQELVRSASNTFLANRAGSAAGDGSGGAVALFGSTTFSDTGSTFARNQAVGVDPSGGAYYSQGKASTFTGTTFAHNAAGPTSVGDPHGGAIYTDESSTALSQVTVSHNRSGKTGGGIVFDDGKVTVQRSTIVGNVAGSDRRAGRAGGIAAFNNDIALIENSTLTGNAVTSRPHNAGRGGAIVSDTDTALSLRFSTVTGNVAKRGGGLFADGVGDTLLGNILTRNHTAGGVEQDCDRAGPGDRANSLGGNLVGQKACLTTLQASDDVTRKPHLGPLRDNGGPTQTMAPSAASPAVGRVDMLVPATDQRGRPRPRHHADAGAYELPARHRTPLRPDVVPGRGRPGIRRPLGGAALQIGMGPA